ncbi:MAG: hypothetical protein GC149_15965 [Gammaproteobacteria bacterium]|nr:hypothetical protein [Gammaproteobacteria bacterium]
MAFLSQEIVDYLNQTHASGLGDWLERNPVMRNFVTSPYISIRPTAMPQAQRITAFEGQSGRFIEIRYRDGSHRYIINVQRWNLSVRAIEALIHDVEVILGSCHVERSYVILFVPAGYSLQVADQGDDRALRLQALECADIGLETV